MAYSHFCYSVTADNQNLRIITNIEVDFNECMFGIFGVFINDALDCQWKKYWIEVPVFNEGFDYFDGQWTFVPENCIVSEQLSIFKMFNQNID